MLCCAAEIVNMGKGDDGIDLLDGSVLQQRLLDSVMVDCSFSIAVAFELPCIFSLVVEQLGVVVSLVEILKHCGQDFRRLIRKVDPASLIIVELSAAGGFQESGTTQDIFMSCEETLLRPDADRDDRRSQCARRTWSVAAW